MAISESIVIFAGLVFAHAVWNVSDLPKDELLVPIVMVERSGERELMRFEADTQELAIANAKKWIAKNGDSFDAWVFAREGQVKENGKYVDTISVEARAKGDKETLMIVQRFQPFSKGKFKLLGQSMVGIDGVILDEKASNPLREQLKRGIDSHPKAAGLWKEWVKP